MATQGSEVMNQLVMKSIHAVSLDTKKCRLLNVCVDGVSVDSNFIRSQLCAFLDGKQSYLGTTDTNHNCKSYRYQYIGGSATVSVGNYVLDPGLLHVANVGIDLWRIKDYASDLLVLKLASTSTVDALCSLVGKEEDPVVVTVLCVSLYFMRLQLYGIYCKKLDSIHRISFLWASMLWMTSMKNVCVITKRNIVTSTIGLVFLIARSDVAHPRHTISEPYEISLAMQDGIREKLLYRRLLR